MNAWKVAGELHTLKNIMFSLNSPSRVVKAAFYLSSGLMRMLLYPYYTLNLVKINDPRNLSIRLEIRGRG